MTTLVHRRRVLLMRRWTHLATRLRAWVRGSEIAVVGLAVLIGIGVGLLAGGWARRRTACSACSTGWSRISASRP
jgi:hypothetical protein